MARHVDIAHINERRLRPIYDCLDNGNNKKALQEAEKVLKKQKDLQCAKVLKALALLRLGRHEESLALLHEVHSEAPIDDSTLQAMTICYRELHKIELIADVYELATKKEPSNEELHSHLFMAYVRMGDYKKQQLTAMNLYKLKPKNPYYFWAVMSIYMQAISVKDQTLAQKVILPLSEKMCRKFIDESKIEAEAEVELFLMILERQRKYEEMLSVIDGPLGDKLSNHLDFLARRKADLLLHLKNYKNAFESYRMLIENNIDQLEYYSQMYNIAVLLDDTITNTHDDSSIDGKPQQSCHYLAIFVKFVEKCIEKAHRMSAHKNTNRPIQRLRGPFMAKIELFDLLKKRQQLHGDADHLLKRFANTTTDLLLEYFEMFGTKFACIYDMFYLFSKCDLKKDEIDMLLIGIKQGIVNLDIIKDSNAIQRNLCFHFISHYMGQYDSLDNDERLKLICSLIDHYDAFHQNLPIGTDISSTEPADPYILLTAQILVESKEELEDCTVFQLIVIIERALNKSPSNYHLKIFLLKLYNAVGAVGSSHSLLDTLDIKHIQYDSMGYLMSTPLIVAGHFATASYLLGIALRFYSANHKDTLDYLITCYKFGSFTKVEEIIKLRDRLNNSLQYCSVAVERMFLDLILETKDHHATENIINYMEIDPEKDKFIWEDLYDNRDFTVLRANHHQSEMIIEKKKLQTFNDEILWLKYRNLLIRAIAAAHYSVSEPIEKNDQPSNGPSNGINKRNAIDILNNLILNLKEYIDTVNCSKFADSFLPLQGPQPSRLFIYSKRSHLKVLSVLFDFILALHNDPKDYSFVLTAVDHFSCIVRDAEQIVANTKSLFSLRSTFEELTDCIETLSISVILIGISQSIMKSKMNINKKNKKKKDISGTGDVIIESLIDVYGTMINGFKDSAEKIETIVKSLNVESLINQKISIDDMPIKSSHLLEENGFNETLTMVREKFDNSYGQSLKELNDLLKIKIIYLHSLKL